MTSSRRTVLHLVDDLTVGGAQRLVVQLANDRAARGDAVLVCARAGGTLWADLAPAVERRAWRPGIRLLDAGRLVVRLRRLVRTRRVDLLHVHGRMLAVAAGLAVRGLPAVVVEHVHNTFATTAVARLLSFRSDHLIACGSAVERMLVDEFRRPRTSVRLIVNGVADGGSPAPLPSVTPPSKLRVVGIGALNGQKDPGRFVRVVRELHRLGALDQATWVGPGNTARWNEAAALVGIAERLRFIGPVDDARSELDGAHLLLLSSRHEGLPLVALEALAAGRGVVLPGVGSCRDVFAVEPGVGVLYPHDEDDAAIARRLLDAAERGAVEDWGRSARRAYETAFRLETMLDAVDRLYAEVLSA